MVSEPNSFPSPTINPFTREVLMMILPNDSPNDPHITQIPRQETVQSNGVGWPKGNKSKQNKNQPV